MLHTKHNNSCSLCVNFQVNPLAGYGYGICQKFFETIHIKDTNCHSYQRAQFEPIKPTKPNLPIQTTLDL